jgi:hypothetical protein
VTWGSAGAKLYLNGDLVGSDPTTGMPASGYGGSLLVNSGAGSAPVDELRISRVQRTGFSLPAGTYPLTVATSGSGTGSVASEPEGIACGSTCSAAFAAGAAVALTATPAPGSTFIGWGGACTGTGACSVTMDAAKSVTASFTATHALTVKVAGSGGGSVSSAPVGIACSAACTASFEAGATITLTASASTGGAFREWRGDACAGSTGPTCEVPITAARTVTAVFSATFTDPTLTAGMVMKASHVAELRAAVDTLRSRKGLAAFAWTDATLTPGTTTIKRAHLVDLRAALAEAYQAAPATPLPTYTDAVVAAGATPISVVHLRELREAVGALE